MVKKIGYSVRLRSNSNAFRSIPEEPADTAMEEVYQEMGTVITGLAEFKTELMQLHALVREWWEGS